MRHVQSVYMAGLGLLCFTLLFAPPARAQDDVDGRPTLSASIEPVQLGSGLGQAPNQRETGSPNTLAAYRLGTGDKVQITVYGEDDLSGPFDVDGSGNVRLPLIGQVHAAGLTLKEFELAIEGALANGFLINPRVNAAVTNYRPFSILGEVNKPGEYPYENGMTVLNAVAIGGGFTYRAEKETAHIRRKGSSETKDFPADNSTMVYPGDTVTIDERIF